MVLAIDDIVFQLAMTQDYNDVWIVDHHLFNSKRGVYAVYFNDDVQYVGKYSNGLKNRWKNHFKIKTFLQDSTSGEFKVYACDVDFLKKSYDNSTSQFINQAGVEQMILENNNFQYNEMMNA